MSHDIGTFKVLDLPPSTLMWSGGRKPRISTSAPKYFVNITTCAKLRLTTLSRSKVKLGGGIVITQFVYQHLPIK